MKRRIMTWSTLYIISMAMTLPGLVMPVSAMPEAQTFTDSTKIPLSFAFGGSCGSMNGLTATGKAHLLVHTTVNANGDVNISMEFNYNLSGVDTNGVKYTANSASHLTENKTLTWNPFPMEVTAVDHINFVSAGSTDNFLVKARFHLIINANGEVTVDSSSFEGVCQG
jgi:hypothetical protein